VSLGYSGFFQIENSTNLLVQGINWDSSPEIRTFVQLDLEDHVNVLLSERKSKNPLVFQSYFGQGSIIGTSILLVGLILPQFPFIGLQNESYSMLNHFVSELGFKGVSEWAIVFNICLFIGALMFIPFVFYVKDQIKGRLWKVGTLFGYIAAIGCALVGVFPMNNETLIAHAFAALAFFMGSNFMMIIFSISLLREKDPKLPRKFALAGFIVLFLNFLMFFQDF
jgi:hypothetical membrane protein